MSFKKAKVTLFLALSMTFTTGKTAVLGDIECEGTSWPSCCVAIATSHGTGIWYIWGKTKGYYDTAITLGNFAGHHCYLSDRGSFQLDTESYFSNPQGGINTKDPTGFSSFGSGGCPAPGSGV